MSVDIWHNVLWSRYRGAVFSALHALAHSSNVAVLFKQIAETERARVSLGGVDLSYHIYPYELMFRGSYENVPYFKLIAKLFLATWRSPADLVILAGYSRLEYWAQLVALLFRGKSIAVFCDSTALDREFNSIKYFAKRFFFRSCDVIFCYGERSKEYILSHGVDADRIVSACQAAALPHDYSATDVAAHRLKKLAAVPTILYVGRFSKEKSLSTLLDAFFRIKQLYPKAMLRFVGQGPERDVVMEQARRLGVEGSVEFVGSRDPEALAEEYLSATCLVLPSSSEPWGLVVNEALSYGCPVVVSRNCGCVPELVHDGRTGFAFEVGNADDLFVKLEQLLIGFSDTKAVAEVCLETVGLYTPQAAARQILEGCLAGVAQTLSKIEV